MARSDRKLRLILVGGAGNLSGVPRHIVHLCLALSAFCQIKLISDRDEGGFSNIGAINAKHVVVSGLRNRVSPLRVVAAWIELIRILRAHDCDLVWLHARLSLILGRMALVLRLWRPDTPVAITYHGLPFGKGHHPLASTLSKWLETALLRACPALHIVFLTPEMKQRMEQKMHTRVLAKHHLHVLPNCSDLGPMPSPRRTNTKRIVMTVRTGRQKDILSALRTFARLPDDYTLHLCGPGTDDPKFLKSICGRIPEGVVSRIAFLGQVADVRHELASADAYLLSSRYEGLPIGTLEAFEAGLPIILRDFDGATDLALHHPMALVLSFQHPAQDAAAIVGLIERYQATRETHAAKIHEVWKKNWAPEIFAANAQTLVREITQTAA